MWGRRGGQKSVALNFLKHISVLDFLKSDEIWKDKLKLQLSTFKMRYREDKSLRS